MARFNKLQQMCKEVIGNHIGGKPAYRISHYKGTDEMGDYEYWDFHEVNEKGREHFGFSSPNFKFFDKILTNYLTEVQN
jgi:hypothetical protein